MPSTESIIMFKPDAAHLSVDIGTRHHLLHEVGSALLVATGLTILDHHAKTLEENEVRELYAKALAPNPQDEAIWGTAWKDDVVKHIASGPVESYLLLDDHGDAMKKPNSSKIH